MLVHIRCHLGVCVLVRQHLDAFRWNGASGSGWDSEWAVVGSSCEPGAAAMRTHIDDCVVNGSGQGQSSKVT